MLKVKNLTKRYGQHIALNNISFEVKEGEIIGFLGPNGAGKTTTMDIITGYISATEGSVFINGINILDDPKNAKKNIGYLPDTPPLYNTMTVNEYLIFVCNLKKVEKKKQKEMIAEIMETTRITDMKDRILGNLSKGYKQRVGFAQALVGFPKILILDEPTVGLDPKQILEIRDVIKKLGKKHTVILSSHILSEISEICDRIIIINKGNIVSSSTTENLFSEYKQDNSIYIRVKGKEKEISKVLISENNKITFKFLGSLEKDTSDFRISHKNILDKNKKNIIPQKEIVENVLEEIAEDILEENSVEEIAEDILEENSVEEVVENVLEENSVEEIVENVLEENSVEEISENVLEDNSVEEIVENVLEENSVEEISENVLEDNSVEENSFDLREFMFNLFSTKNIPLLEMKSKNLSLEEIFIQITNKGGVE